MQLRQIKDYIARKLAVVLRGRGAGGVQAQAAEPAVDAEFALGQLIGQEAFLEQYGHSLDLLHADGAFMEFVAQLRRQLDGLERTDTGRANREIMNAFYYGRINQRFVQARQITNGVLAYGKQASAHISIYYAMYVLDQRNALV